MRIGADAPSRQHIYNVEATGKVSLEVLAQIARALFTNENEPNQIDALGLLRLVGFAFGIDTERNPAMSTRTLKDEIFFQKSLTRGDAVWIVSDTLAETKSLSTLENTIDGIKNSDLSYTYFVPPGNLAWRALLALFRERLPISTLEAHVRFVELTPFAFPCRMRIARPGRHEQEAVYAMMIPESGEYAYYPATQSLVYQWVKNVNLLLEVTDRMGSDSSTDLNAMQHVLYEELGLLKVLFPKNRQKS